MSPTAKKSHAKKTPPAVQAAPAPAAPREHAPLRITDTSLRDAHQSLWATRMRTSDILEILDVVDNVGF